MKKRHAPAADESATRGVSPPRPPPTSPSLSTVRNGIQSNHKAGPAARQRELDAFSTPYFALLPNSATTQSSFVSPSHARTAFFRSDR